MSFIKNLSVIVTPAHFKYPRRVMQTLQSCEYEKDEKGQSYVVRGTFKEVLLLYNNLQAAENNDIGPATHGSTRQRDEHSPAQVTSVVVSAVFMDYIKQKCTKELDRIQGNSFVIETKSSPSDTVVIFRPQHGSIPHARADYVRQRFITFYQRTASDLKVTSLPLKSHNCKDLQRKFPHLLFQPSHNKYEVTVTGPFMHIAKLQEFISQNTPTSSKGAVNKSPTGALSSRTSGPQPTQTRTQAPSKEPEKESCPICMEPIAISEKQTLQCKHSFCRDCLKTAFEYKPVCPTCGKLYGTLTGTQPKGGRMSVSNNHSSLPGYEKYGTIIIHYYIPSGIQKEEHPNPGQSYEGVSRTAYLPDSSEGRKVLTLLRRAFDQRLIFTVGRSTTNGRNNMVTWNDIHHKTSTRGGPSHYGYPDPDYLNRVQDELKVKGIQ